VSFILSSYTFACPSYGYIFIEILWCFTCLSCCVVHSCMLFCLTKLSQEYEDFWCSIGWWMQVVYLIHILWCQIRLDSRGGH
jgi:hypothetical protein